MKLTEFADAWLANAVLNPPVSAYERAAGNVGLTLYRDQRFQVQLWTSPPNSVVTPHRHPNIDTWLVRVAGKLRLAINGRFIPLHEMERTAWLGMRTWRYRIRANDLHAVEIAEPGGAFLAISERVDGQEPGSVHRDLAGAPLDQAHAAELGER
jgi:hypothetical protein